MAVGDIFRIQVNMVAGSQPTMNVLHCREQVGRAANESGALNAINVAVDFYSALAAQMSEDWRVISIRAGIVTPFVADAPRVLVLGGAAAIIGAIVGDMVPSNAPFLVSLYTLQLGRSGRGRIFIPGLPEASQGDGQLTNAAWIELQTIADAELLTQHGPYVTGTGEYRLNVFSGALGPSADSNVQVATVRTNLANMRSRRAFEGFST